MAKLTRNEIVKEFPELEGVELNGSSDFNTVAEVIGSRNPKLVWACINALAVKAKPSPKVNRLLAKLEK